MIHQHRSQGENREDFARSTAPEQPSHSWLQRCVAYSSAVSRLGDLLLDQVDLPNDLPLTGYVSRGRVLLWSVLIGKGEFMHEGPLNMVPKPVIFITTTCSESCPLIVYQN